MSVLAPLGRLRQWDDQNLEHVLPKKRIPAGIRRRHWHVHSILDQGNTSECVGHAGWSWLAGGPVVNRPPFTPTVLYNWARERDEWPGENYEGTSTLGLMKALKERGYINEYKWALDAATIVAWVLTKGPVCVGTNWHLDMFPGIVTKHGFYVEPTGPIEGGHEYPIFGVDLDRWTPDGSKGAVRFPNSWGNTWGSEKGRAWMSIKALDSLIKADGEAVTSTEIRLP